MRGELAMAAVALPNFVDETQHCCLELERDVAMNFNGDAPEKWLVGHESAKFDVRPLGLEIHTVFVTSPKCPMTLGSKFLPTVLRPGSGLAFRAVWQVGEMVVSPLP